MLRTIERREDIRFTSITIRDGKLLANEYRLSEISPVKKNLLINLNCKLYSTTK